MTIQEHIDAEYSAILIHSIIQSTTLIRRTINRQDGYLRVRCTLIDGDLLEIAVHFNMYNGTVVIDNYRYQWMDHAYALRRRWDNASHYPHLPNAPHHCHIGNEDKVEPAELMALHELLELIDVIKSTSSI